MMQGMILQERRKACTQVSMRKCVWTFMMNLDDNMMKMKLLGLDSAESYGKLDAEWDDMGKKPPTHAHMKDIERVMISSG